MRTTEPHGKCWMMRALNLIGFIALLGFVGCSNVLPLNSAPPAYMKLVHLQQEGSDGFLAYIVLADSSGAMTTAYGFLKLEIVEVSPEGFLGEKLYSATFPVKRSDFHDGPVGVGAFQQDVIMYSVGRIPYSALRSPPGPNLDCLARVTFTTSDGRVLRGKDLLVM